MRRRRLILSQTVREEVIPRLLAQLPPQLSQAAVTEAQIIELADISLQGQGDEAIAFVTSLQQRGYAADVLYLSLLSPAAALLGQYWENDVCNFADVTIGLVHLQQAMRALGPAFFEGHPLKAPVGPRALLMPLPGEQHTFGLSMLADFFRRAGWNTWSGTVETSAALREMVSSEWVDVVGFSVACDDMLDGVRREIEVAREASRNRDLVVMVGGPPFVREALLAQKVGADGTAKDGLQAVAAAQRLLPRRFKERGRDAAS
jgi:methanogenic corrinoid protein MtbC1